MQRYLKASLPNIDEENLGKFACPETMGKLNQLGTLEEVPGNCTKTDERLIPCIDWTFKRLHLWGAKQL